MKASMILACSLAAISSVLAYEYSYDAGWNLLGAVEDVTPSSLNAQTLWVYRDGGWLHNDSIGEIRSGEGFWLYTTTPSEEETTSGGLQRILYAPINETTTYLIDTDKNVLQTWTSSYRPGLAAYMQEDGTLIRAGDTGNSHFAGNGGTGGIIQKIDSDGQTVLWEYTVSSDEELQHHDLEILPNGNILFIAWEVKSASEALSAGRESSTIDSSGELWPDVIQEVSPTTGEIIWEWKVWDHLTTDASAHPGKIDINYVGNQKELRDWNHVNGIDYNADLDQVMISAKNFSEVWVIDHSLSTAQAATSKGDLLYRFGNPDTDGSQGQRLLYGQHDAEWVDNDTVMLFNNGLPMGSRNYSSVDVYHLPVSGGEYSGVSDSPELIWSYTADDLFSSSISGVSALDDGGYLITEGEEGRMFVVNEDKEITWEYTIGSPVFKAEHYGY